MRLGRDIFSVESIHVGLEILSFWVADKRLSNFDLRTGMPRHKIGRWIDLRHLIRDIKMFLGKNDNFSGAFGHFVHSNLIR